jgi:NADP-dependent 3-hydroxy acid dehydrogenase YdfG
VVLAARREEVLRATAAELGPQAAWYLRRHGHRSDGGLVADVEARHGPVSILVNNAGSTLEAGRGDERGRVQQIMDVHVMGAFP